MAFNHRPVQTLQTFETRRGVFNLKLISLKIFLLVPVKYDSSVSTMGCEVVSRGSNPSGGVKNLLTTTSLVILVHPASQPIILWISAEDGVKIPGRWPRPFKSGDCEPSSHGLEFETSLTIPCIVIIHPCLRTLPCVWRNTFL